MPSCTSDTLIFLLKKRYWLLLEKTKSRTQSLRHSCSYIANDVWEQLAVLAVFVKHVALRNRAFVTSSEAGTFAVAQRKTLLMVSYYSPPYTAAYGTERVAKLAKYLSRMGWNIVLLSSSPEEQWEAEKSATSKPEGVEIVRRVQRGRLNVFAEKGLAVPDDFIGWVRPALDRARDLVLETKPAAIYATAPPYSNLLVGAILSRMYDVPLVSDFRDPWTRIDTFWKKESPVLRLVNRLLEKAVLRVSDAVVMVDEKKYCDQYFVGGSKVSHKIVSITNGFDEEEFAGLGACSGRANGDKFVVSYVGGVYDSETFLNVIRPLELWRQRYPNDFESVLFEYAGQSGQWFKDYKVPFELRLRGYLSHRESINLRFRSHLQLFSQPSHFKPHVLSGKIFEMIRVGVPIVAFTNPEGSAADLIRRTKTGFVVKSNDHEAGAQLLKELFEKWRRGELAINPDHAEIGRYRRDELARRFADVLQRAIGERRAS